MKKIIITGIIVLTSIYCFGQKIDSIEANFIKIEHVGISPPSINIPLILLKKEYAKIGGTIVQLPGIITDKKSFREMKNFIKKYDYYADTGMLEYGTFDLTIGELSSSETIITEKYVLTSRSRSVFFFEDLSKDLSNHACDINIINYINNYILKQIRY